MIIKKESASSYQEINRTLKKSIVRETPISLMWLRWAMFSAGGFGIYARNNKLLGKIIIIDDCPDFLQYAWAPLFNNAAFIKNLIKHKKCITYDDMHKLISNDYGDLEEAFLKIQKPSPIKYPFVHDFMVLAFDKNRKNIIELGLKNGHFSERLVLRVLIHMDVFVFKLLCKYYEGLTHKIAKRSGYSSSFYKLKSKITPRCKK